MTESKINVASGFNGGVSVSLRADSAAEFEALLADAANSPSLTNLLTQAGVVPGMTQAVATVQAAFPQASPVSTVGQPLPQPGIGVPSTMPAAPAAPAQPPTVVNPGPCAHGDRIYKDTNTSRGPWRRWECSLAWIKDNAAHNASRCKPVNA
jgi:hypothetical protein